MPAVWNDISNEIRKIIIEYVVANTTVTFAPRHPATRAARKKDEAKAQEPAHFPLLLVSKQFLTYAELNDAVLKNAAINYKSGRDLTALDARFGKGGIESVRALSLSIDKGYHGSAALLNIPSKLQSRLTRLQLMKINVRYHKIWIREPVTLREVIEVAKGRVLGTHPLWGYDQTESVRASLQQLLEATISRCSYKLRAWLIEFLTATAEQQFERAIQFHVHGGASREPEQAYNEPVEFTSSLQCCRFVNHPSVILPQRLYQYWIDSQPRLTVVNDVELDKYYTI